MKKNKDNMLSKYGYDMLVRYHENPATSFNYNFYGKTLDELFDHGYIDYKNRGSTRSNTIKTTISMTFKGHWAFWAYENAVITQHFLDKVSWTQ